MGINAGAAAFIVGGIMLFGTPAARRATSGSPSSAPGFATVVVYGVASLGREGATPIKLALAGAAITAGLTSLTSAIVMVNVDAFQELRIWQVGSLAGRYMAVFQQTAPFIAVGLGRGCAGRRPGAQRPGARRGRRRALGQRVRLTRALLFVLVACCAARRPRPAGRSCSSAWSCPHLARLCCGPDYRWILPVLDRARPDRAARSPTSSAASSLSPGELQVGVVLGVLGAPVFIALVRYRDLAEL